MRKKTNHNREGLLKGIGLAYSILLLHVLLLAGVILLVFFFGGLVEYIVWIVLGGIFLTALFGYLFFRRIRREGRSLRDALHSPDLNGRALEVSFMGGMATFRLGPPNPRTLIDVGPQGEPLQLEDPQVVNMRDVEALAHLLEKKLITPEEYAAAKRKFFGG